MDGLAKEAMKEYNCEAYDAGCTQSVCVFLVWHRLCRILLLSADFRKLFRESNPDLVVGPGCFLGPTFKALLAPPCLSSNDGYESNADPVTAIYTESVGATTQAQFLLV